MATTIKLKNGSGAPSAGNLVQGEPALDLTNKRLYTENSSGAVIEVGTNPTSLTTGAVTTTGNLLVGNTVTDPATSNVNGVAITAGGEVIASLNGVAAQFNRRTSDGDIAVFKKGGTTVGSIGVLSNRLYIGNGDTGLKFSGANDLISPIDASSGAGRDAAIDLGSSGARFKDLHLSGTVNAGGGTIVSSGSNAFSSKAVGGYAIQAYQDATSADHTALDLRSDATTNTRFLIRGYNNAAVTPAEVFSVGADGTVTAGGLDVDNLKIQSGLTASPTNDGANYIFRSSSAHADYSGGDLIIQARSSASRDIYMVTGSPTPVNRLQVKGDGDISFYDTAGANAKFFWDASAESLGIGTSSPVQLLHLRSNTPAIEFDDSAFATVRGRIYSNEGNLLLEADYNNARNSSNIAFNVDGSEAMRVDSSGNLIVSGDVLPTTDAGFAGHSDLGDPAKRFEDAYVRDGVTTGSDRRDKQDIEELSDAEQRVAVACKGLLRKWRWIDSVEAKGDDARIHFGIIAQDLQDAFTAEGLDAGRYAMFISSTWWESTEIIPAVEAQEAVVDEEGNVVEEAVEGQEERTVVHTHNTAEEAPEGSVERTRLGVRYSELLAFIIAAI